MTISRHLLHIKDHNILFKSNIHYIYHTIKIPKIAPETVAKRLTCSFVM